MRVASLGTHLFLHSAFPTDAADAVFFGPDTYRFASFLRARFPLLGRVGSVIDLGAGSGAGAVVAGSLAPEARLILVDINPLAARLAGINCAAADIAADIALGEALPKGADVIIANPPYIVERDDRLYRDGGGGFGSDVACEWAHLALSALVPGGTFLLYSGGPVVGGEALLLSRLGEIAAKGGHLLSAAELDPDVFGDELASPAYRDVERIALFGITIVKK